MITQIIRVSPLIVLAFLISSCGSSTPSLMTLLDKKSTKMEWVKRCGDIPNHDLPGEKADTCWTKYEKISKKNGKLTLFTGVRMGGAIDDQLIVFAVPYGVDLDKGMRIKFDNEPPIKIRYSQCSQAMCYAQLPLTNELLIKLKYSSRLVVAVMSKYNKAYGYSVPLYRFVYAYNKKGQV